MDQPLTSPKLHEDVANLLAQISRLWRSRIDDRLQPFGLTEASWLPLFYLSEAPSAMRQKELAARLLLDSSSVVRVLDSLQTLGLIERREEAADRRAKAITLTPLGRETAAQIEAVVQQVRGEVLGIVPTPELAGAAQVLQTIHRRLCAFREETKA